MEKFIHLKVSNMRLDDVSGLIEETVVLGNMHSADLDALCTANFLKLTAAYNRMFPLLNKNLSNILTQKIVEKNRQCITLLTEIKRTAAIAQKSLLPEKSAAGATLMELLHPFWNINKKPIMSRTAQINLISDRYNASQPAQTAAETLELAQIITVFFSANAELETLYNRRLENMAEAKTPAASSEKRRAAAAYNAFCTSVASTVNALPTEGLQTLFNEMNEIRRKYIRRLPVKLSEKNTSTMPIDIQAYNGRHITPLPCVFVQIGKESVELVFSRDFTVSYRNNVNAGEAKLIVHGKGKYTGTYETAFHITGSGNDE
jgi:hypothetical protein